MAQLLTFGGLRLVRAGDGDDTDAFTQSKPLALLAYLATARPHGSHRRDTLTALFWPELDETRARGALSQTLLRLRGVVGSDVLVSSGSTDISINADCLWCDATAFVAHTEKGDWARALELYSGEFLEGVHLSGLAEFERWAENERVHRRAAAAQAAWNLAEQAESSGDVATAVKWARRGAELAMHDEIAVRRYLKTLRRAGDRAGAVAAYEEFARRFKADFDVAPSAETEAIIQEVRNEGWGDAGRSRRVAQENQHAISRERMPPEPELSSAGWDPPQPPPPRGIRVRAWSLSVILAAMAAVVILAAWPRPERHFLPSWFDLALPDSVAPRADLGVLGSLALSPDGSITAYVGGSKRALFIRAADELAPRRLGGTDGAACPSFSPDGRWIVFGANPNTHAEDEPVLRLKKVNVRGGFPITIADSVDGCGVWTDRNEIVFGWRGALFRVPADGGSVSLVARMDSSKGIGVMLPSHALPGGNSALICVSEDVTAKWQVGVVALPSGRVKRLTSGGFPRCPARYAEGHVVYAQNRAIHAVPFSLGGERLTGAEAVLLRDTVFAFSTSAIGTLAYVSSAPQTHSLVAVSEEGNTRTLGGDAGTARRNGSPPMPLDTARYSWPRLSPDGKRVVMEMLTGGDLWVYDIPRRTIARLTYHHTGIQPLGWTPDGRSVVFTQIDSGKVGGPRRIMSQPWDGSAPAREFIRFPAQFLRSIYRLFDISIGPPHGSVAFVMENFSDSADIWIAPLDTPSAARPLVATKAREFQPRLSPDGTLLAYTSDETGRAEIYVRAIGEASTRSQISTGGGWQPLWTRDGRQLLYRAPGFMMRATISRDGVLRAIRRDTLFRDTFNQHDVVNYDVFPGGKELLMIRPNPPEAAHAAVVLEWRELLRHRLSVH